MEKIAMHVFTYVGGIKGFAADNNSVTKWCLNRLEQDKSTNGLKQMAGVISSADFFLLGSTSFHFSKDFDHQILENDCTNLFSITREATKLFNLSSGVAVEDDLGDKILNITDGGK